MIDRRRYMGLTALPYDYEVEWLESMGTQWIDTGYCPKNHLTVIEEKHYYGYNPYSGSQSGMYCVQAWGCKNNNNTTFAVWTDYIMLPEKTIRRIKYNSWNDVFIGNGIVKVNNVEVGTYTTDEINLLLPIYLFAWNLKGTPNPSIGIMSSFKASENGVAILDLIPVVKNNKGYMYNKATGLLLPNHGDFIVGPRV